jgi:hypothetical protein
MEGRDFISQQQPLQQGLQMQAKRTGWDILSKSTNSMDKDSARN